ncbi:hypothetical protein IEU95_13545 [Hoyosella rhizosphaerae]|uniref:Heme peroxidase n=1 Tax=Hoyosella rhizosphaerae TaxID=1755582 RepID=A0A916UF95_9ACTN|nr:hypothetical protein [Hoyosella rhizosphaerae]MBN4927863.1 hypothetical protein [Hoyosella rhizosphaerae]GGC70558.1 hypothetical protein GCM10011410_24260 [Hoyosella rhizosphaerae]
MDLPAYTLDRVVTECHYRLGATSSWAHAGAYRESLALCIVDAVQSSAGNYPATIGVVDRFAAYQRHTNPAHTSCGVRDLLRTFEEAGSAASWAGKVGMFRRRHHSPTQIVKSRSIQRAAEALYSLRIDSTADLAAMYPCSETRALVVRAWRSVINHDFTSSWDYLLALSGVRSPDPATSLAVCRRFFAGIAPRWKDDPYLVDEVAHRMSTSVEDLTLAIHRWSASNRVFADQDLENSQFVIMPWTAATELN